MSNQTRKRSLTAILAVLCVCLAAAALPISRTGAAAAESGIEWGAGGTVDGRTITVDNSESYGTMASADGKRYGYNVYDFDFALDLKADDSYAMFDVRTDDGGAGLSVELKADGLCLRGGTLNGGKYLTVPASVLQLKDTKTVRHLRLTVDDEAKLLTVVFDNDPVLKRFEIEADVAVAAEGGVQFRVNKAKLELTDFRAYTVEQLGRKMRETPTLTRHNDAQGTHLVLGEDSVDYHTLVADRGTPAVAYTQSLAADEFFFDISFFQNETPAQDWVAFQYFRAKDPQSPIWGTPGNGTVVLRYAENNFQFYYFHGSTISRSVLVYVSDVNLYDGKPHAMHVVLDDEARTAILEIDGTQWAELSFADYVSGGQLKESDYREEGNFASAFGQPFTAKISHIECYDAYDGYRDYLKADSFFWKTNYYVAGNELWTGADDDGSLWGSVRQTAANLYFASQSAKDGAFAFSTTAITDEAVKQYDQDVVRFDFAGTFDEGAQYVILGFFTQTKKSYGDAIGYYFEMNNTGIQVYANATEGSKNGVGKLVYNVFDGKSHSFFLQRDETAGQFTLRVDGPEHELTFDIPAGLAGATGGFTALANAAYANVTNFSVYQSVIPVAGIVVDEETVNLAMDEAATHQLTASVRPENATFADLVYEVVEGADVATVSASGLVTGLKSGKAVVRVSAERYPDVYKDVTVNVSDQTVTLTGISVPAELTLEKGRQLTFAPIFAPADATFRDVVYEVTGTGAEISDSGVLTALSGTGTVTVTVTSARYPGVSAQCVVTLVPLQPQSVGFRYGVDSALLEAGGTWQIEPVIAPAAVEDKSCSYVSADEAVATVDGNGLVTAVGSGKTVVTVTANVKDLGEVSASFTVEAVAKNASKAPTYDLTDIDGSSLDALKFNNAGSEDNFGAVDGTSLALQNFGGGQPMIFLDDTALAADYLKFDLRVVMSSQAPDWAFALWMRTATPGTAFYSANDGFGLLFYSNGIKAFSRHEGAQTQLGEIGLSLAKYLSGDAHTYELTVDTVNRLLRVCIDGKNVSLIRLPETAPAAGGFQFIANSNNCPRPTEFEVRNLYAASIAETLAPKGLAFEETELSLKRGQSVALRLRGAAADAVLYETTSSSLTVTADGRVTAVSIPSGSVVVSAYLPGWEGYAAKATVTVLPPDAAGISLSKENIFLYPGESDVLIALFDPTDAVGSFVFTSAAPDVATVDGNGTIRAVAPGTARVKVTSADGSVTAHCNVTVQTLVEVVVGNTNWGLAIGLPAAILVVGAAVIAVLMYKKLF